MIIEDLTEQGVREGLQALADARKALRAQLARVEETAALAVDEANHLRKLTSHIDLLEESYRVHLGRLETMAKDRGQ